MAAAAAPADVVLKNGRIYTLSTVQPDPQQAICWAKNRILAVGSDDAVRPHTTSRTEVIDLKGAVVVPGLTDSHAHLEGLGRMLDEVNLLGVPSFEALSEKVAERAARSTPGEWILGRGWDPGYWPGRRFPGHGSLSRLTPNNPVWLKRKDGHSGLANQRALEIVGIGRNTPDPDGGQILRDDQGNPTGVLTEHAMQLVERCLPKPTTSDYQRWFTLAQEECAKHGLTGVHDAGITAGALEALKVMVREEMLGIRLYGMFWAPDVDHIARFAQKQTPFVRFGREGLLTLRAIKLYMDGSLGSRSAWMLNPYLDAGGSDYVGLNLLPVEKLVEIGQEAVLRGYQVCTHAIGDRANREALNAYETILSELVEGDHRLRIEHAQFVHPADIPRFGELGVIASVQPSHAVADMRMVTERLGPAGHPGAYPWRRLVDTRARVPLGSDFPVEKASPLWTLYCAVTRQDAAGRPPGGWMPEMCLTPREALLGMTREAAFASFQEDDLGTLASGNLADMTILSHDVLTLQTGDILRTEVLGTVIGGKFRFRGGV